MACSLEELRDFLAGDASPEVRARVAAELAERRSESSMLLRGTAESSSSMLAACRHPTARSRTVYVLTLAGLWFVWGFLAALHSQYFATSPDAQWDPFGFGIALGLIAGIYGLVRCRHHVPIWPGNLAEVLIGAGVGFALWGGTTWIISSLAGSPDLGITLVFGWIGANAQSWYFLYKGINTRQAFAELASIVGRQRAVEEKIVVTAISCPVSAGLGALVCLFITWIGTVGNIPWLSVPVWIGFAGGALLGFWISMCTYEPISLQKGSLFEAVIVAVLFAAIGTIGGFVVTVTSGETSPWIVWVPAVIGAWAGIIQGSEHGLHPTLSGIHTRIVHDLPAAGFDLLCSVCIGGILGVSVRLFWSGVPLLIAACIGASLLGLVALTRRIMSVLTNTPTRFLAEIRLLIRVCRVVVLKA